jgi:hypothetical protein
LADPDAEPTEETHLRAALSYERAADFWDSQGRPDKAQAERGKARDERRAAEATHRDDQKRQSAFKDAEETGEE